LYKISLLSFLLVFWYPFIGEQSYMRFGYAVLPNVLFILCELLYNKKKRLGIIIAGAICFALLVEMFVFGARGSFFSLLLFLAIEELLINRENLKRKLAIFLGVLLAVFNIGPIIDFIYNTLLKLGIRSYALIKYRMQLNRGIEIASSGRVNLYDTAIEQLKQSPIFGLPILLSNEDGSMVYVHNLFLQTWMDLGIVGLAILIGFLLFVIWKIWRRDIGRDDRILIAAGFFLSIGRLLFSSVLWRRPEFWLLVFMSMKMGKSQNNIEV
jgi:O-Antigen ligase.